MSQITDNPSVSHISDKDGLLEVLEQAYGLLWLVPVNTETPNGHAISTARKQLLKHIDKEGQRRGIEYARAVIWAFDRARTVINKAKGT